MSTSRPRRASARRPLPQGSRMYTPAAGSARRTVERSSARPLVLLHQLPTWLVPVALVVALAAGLTIKGWLGAAALVLVAAFLGWLAYVSWPALAPRGRLLRAVVIGAVLVLAVVQARR